MPKFEIKNTQYAKFFESRDAANALSILINNPEVIKMNYNYWRSRFAAPNGTIARSNDGVALFQQKARKLNAPGMLSLRAPLGDSAPREKQGIDVWNGSIPDFIADGFVETAMERMDKERMLNEYFGNDADIVAHYAMDIQELVDDANQTMNYLAAQAQTSKTIVYDKGKGAQITFANAPIPEENFLKAGTVAWADPGCKLIDQMQAIEEKVRGIVGESVPFVWDFPVNIFKNVFLKNAQVIEYVRNWRKLNDKTYADVMSINEAMFTEAFADGSVISPVLVSKEAEKDGGVIISGWKTGVVTFRPQGYVGGIKKASILDEVVYGQYGSSVISKVFANRDIFTIVNTTLNNGSLKEWHTDLMLSAIPCLEEWPYHFIIDTLTAE